MARESKPRSIDTRLVALIVVTLIGLAISSFIPVVFFIGSVVLMTVFVASRLEVPLDWPLFILSLLLALVAADTIIDFMPVFPDARHYRRVGTIVLTSLETGAPFTLEQYSLREVVYAGVISSLYGLFDDTRTIIRIVNVGGFAVAATYWFRIIIDEFDTAAARLAVPLFAVWPSATLYFTATLRESFTLLLLTLSVYHAKELFSGKSPSVHVPAVLATVVLQLFFRPELVPPLLFAGIVTFGWTWKNWTAVLLLPVPAVLLFALQALSHQVPFVPKLFNPFKIGLLEIKRGASASRPRGYLVGMTYDSWFDVVLTIPIRLVYLLFSPFPWQLDSYSMFFPTLDALFMVFVLLSMSVGVVYALQHDRSVPLLFLACLGALLLVGYSLVVSAEGVASRRRLYALPFLIVFAVRGLQVLWSRIEIVSPVTNSKRL